MKDLTKGNEAKNILYFALPMLVGNVFQQLYNTVDGIIVGNKLGTQAQAAVGASFPVIFLLVSLIIGVTMGSTVLIAQYFGAKDMKKVKITIDTAYIFLFASTLIITVTGIIFSEGLLKLLKVPENVLPEAKIYLNIMFGGMIAMFGYNSISAILRGLGDSKTPMLFLIISTVINIILDLVFILVFNWGIAGAAWATVIAQGCSFIFGIYHLNKSHGVFKMNIKNMIFDKKIFILSLKIGLPTGVQQMLFAVGMMALQKIVNSFGEDTMAGYYAGSRIDNFAAMPIMSLSAAISTFVGQNLGANEQGRVKNGLKASIIMSIMVSLIITVVLFSFRYHLVRLFNKNADVINIGSNYVKILAPFYIVIGIQMMLTGLLRGAGDTIIPMIISIIGLWLVRLPIAYLLSPKIGSDGIWWGIPIGWCIGSALTTIYYFTGKWKKKVILQNKTDKNNKIYYNKQNYDDVVSES